MTRRGFFALFLGLFCVLTMQSGPGIADEYTNGARKFVRELADEAISNLTSPNLSTAERDKQFRLLLREKFDVNGMGKWVLGRYWRRATRTEKREYLVLFENLIVATYAKRFSAYTNESLKIIKVASRKQTQLLVFSHIERGSQQKPIRVDWRVDFSDGGYQVVDIVVEGVSMKQTQRSEFASVIRRDGGKVDSLLKALRDKTVTQKDPQ
jgi:phospholipid transport system substrate-binding protein